MVFSETMALSETVDREVRRTLEYLRAKIRERGYTQLEVQMALGWGRSYISQLLTRQKALRVDQILLILNVIGVEPADFYSELYSLGEMAKVGASQTGGLGFCLPPVSPYPEAPVSLPENLEGEIEDLRVLVRGVVKLLLTKEIIDSDELTAVLSPDDWGPAFEA